MVYVGYTFRNVFQPRPGDLYWCTADVGWITGHSYLVYGPLLNGITTLMFEGVPTWPDAGRFWAIVDQYQVNLFYTAPTAIRALESYGLEPLADKSLASLRVIGTVGEPINWEAWQWYYKHVGRERCSVVDTYWQTETGGIVISPLGNLTPQKPTYATLPLPGIEPALLDEHGNEIPGPQNGEAEAEGRLCFKRPWPGIARTTWGDHQRFINTYFSTFPGYYFTGDSARRDAQGFYRITGRVDDVINVSGHRIGTAEVESALDQHPEIIESAVVGYPHEVKGNALYAFVILGPDAASSEHDRIAQEAQAYVKEQIGSFARPEHIQFVSGLPKTRSGKIMRRILRKLTEGKPDELGDTSTLLNPDCVEEIQQHLKVGPARA
jgi:acetyl-CoA synthetase